MILGYTLECTTYEVIIYVQRATRATSLFRMHKNIKEDYIGLIIVP